MGSEQRHKGIAGTASTLVELLRGRAGHKPGGRAYTFLIDGEADEATLTYSALDREARAIGAMLQDQLAAGQRALLLYPPGLPYITAFFGCLYAGVVAVPAYPPRHHRHLSRLHTVAADAQAVAVLTTAPALAKMRAGLAEVPGLAGLRWITTDGPGGGLWESWREPEITGETLAFLQYTSGSTAAPKGVMVSHANLLHNMGLIQAAFGLTGQSDIVSWLPLYHDMGLIGNLLQALYLGAPCTLLSPAAFLQRPLRWLQAISRHRAAFSGGPNFAYDLCVDRIAPEQRAGLDLSSWATAFNGAEPVRAETLERFARAFAPCGFRREACRPVYGLAEATLFVSGKLRGDAAPAHSFQAAALERHQAIAAAPADEARRVLVSCGQAPPGLRLVIADPELLVPCPPGQVGEIWVAGESVTQGYWNRGEETDHTFRAYLVITGEGPFLRTGDLGFIRDGELFVTGRLKDLLIIRGRNHYPQDIELTARRCHTALTSGMGAAFTFEVGGEERLVILLEVDRHLRSRQAGEVIAAVRQALAEDHDLEADSIVLVKTGGLRKTSSGKIQRHLCRQEFLSGGLEVVAASASREVSRDAGGVEPESPPSATQSLPGPEAIRAWLVAKVAARLSLEPAQIDTGAPFSGLGLNSVNAVSISGDLEDWLGRRLSPTLLYHTVTRAPDLIVAALPS